MNKEPTVAQLGEKTAQITTFDEYLKRYQEIANEKFEKLSLEEQAPIRKAADRYRSGSVEYTDAEALQAAISDLIHVSDEEIGVTPEEVDELIAQFEKELNES